MIKKILLSSLGVGLLIATSYARGGTVNLACDPSTDPSVNRFKVYGVPGTNTVFTAGNANATVTATATNAYTVSVTIPTAGQYTFVATFLNTNNLESSNSTSVTTFVPLAGPVNLRVTGVTP